MLDQALAQPSLDFLAEVAKPIPTRVFAEQMGLEVAMLPQFYAWENGFYRAPTLEQRLEYGQRISEHLAEVVARHREEGG